MNLYWTITEKCQLKCQYCYYEVGMCSRQYSDLNIDVFKSEIGEFSKYIESITFTGGEVLLLPNFWEIVELTLANNINVNFLTDGIRLNKANVDKAINLGISGISVSLDSLDSAVNEFQRPPMSKNLSNTTENIIRNIKYASGYIGNKFSLTIIQTITRKNINSIHALVEFAKELKIRHLLHLAGIPNDIGLNFMRIENCTPIVLGVLKKEMKTWAGDNQGFNDYVRIAFSLISNTLPHNTFCPMQKTSLYVNQNGDIFPCFFRRDSILGNIYSSDFLQIIQQKQDSKIRNLECATLGCACMLTRNNYKLIEKEGLFV